MENGNRANPEGETMNPLDRIAEAIGPRPYFDNSMDPVNFQFRLIEWEQKAREHETARAERWKAKAMRQAGNAMDPEQVEAIDKGET